jgi:hypothetical protein
VSWVMNAWAGWSSAGVSLMGLKRLRWPRYVVPDRIRACGVTREMWVWGTGDEWAMQLHLRQ